jgi:endoglucanase
MKNSTKVLALTTTLIVILVVAYVWKQSPSSGLINKISTSNASLNQTYSTATVQNLWLAYRDKIQKDGRTIDRGRDYITTSEGQSYSLLEAVWMDDKETFDRVLKWTNNNLRKRKTDKLFAWKWGKNEDGKWDVIYDGGINSASDADQDIALALIFASKRWGTDDYLDQVYVLLNDIWEREVLQIGDDYYLVAGNWAKTEAQPTINPSYLSFAAYPIFAKVDPAHPWEKLKDTSYKVLNDATASKLDNESSANLPPDWVSLNKDTKEILPPALSDKLTHFSDDAFRVVWRVALDWQWHKDPRAYEYLQKLGYLNDRWEKENKIVATYSHDGKPLVDYESNSMYGGIIPYFKYIQPKAGQEIYAQKLMSLYNADTEDYKLDIGYYAQNWVWFGIALYNEKLINLYEDGI